VPPAGDIRVLVIDDSAYNRQTIAAMLETQPGIKVVGRAGDGEEALKQVFALQPDIITLDLEMPKMDGFTFLRILMSRRPTPVVVISGYAAKENVFKALELGALDFVAKPSRQITPELRSIQDELIAKVKLVTQLRMVSLEERARRPEKPTGATGAFPLMTLSAQGEPPQPPCPSGAAPPKLIAIGSSTGGPPALTQLLGALDPKLGAGVIISQHMPPKFTRAFAERLARATRLRVREAEEGDYVVAGLVLVAPGSSSIAVHREGTSLRVSLEPPKGEHHFTPSVDRMLEAAAQVMGADVLAAILTGMGGDGGRGVRAVKAAGGRVIAEAQETAVIFGMPGEAIATGSVDEVLPLGKIAEAIERFAKP
jgi:two-component system chemotaxis response regulator CheB